MKHRPIRWTALALACLLATACKDKPEPIKPIVQPAIATTAAA
jgi:hypothetical protein